MNKIRNDFRTAMAIGLGLIAIAVLFAVRGDPQPPVCDHALFSEAAHNCRP